jgi:hypothetical protein
MAAIMSVRGIRAPVGIAVLTVAEEAMYRRKEL